MVAVFVTALMASAALAVADLAQKQGAEGCITESGSGGVCANGRGVADPTAIALSPDGDNAYVVSSSWNSVAALRRDEGTGALRPIDSAASCFSELEFVYTDCGEGRDLEGPQDVAVSPDGENVYVAARDSDAVLIFDRDPTTGLLTLSPGDDGCLNASGTEGCAAGRALDEPKGLAISADGENVYVASSGSGGGIAVFERNPASGDLTQPDGAEGCISKSGADGCEAGPEDASFPVDVEVSPDGGTAYVVSPVDDALTLYSRSASGGKLTPIPTPDGCANELGLHGCQSARALGSPVAVTLDPDGASLYVASERADAIVVFDRDPATGYVDQKAGTAGCASNTGWADPMQAGTGGECQDALALNGVGSLAVSPDGRALYASAGESDGLAVFDRASDGAIAQRPGQSGCITDTGFEEPEAFWTEAYCLDGRALRRSSGVAVGPDGMQVYSTALEGGVGSFDVVPAPAAPGEEASVASSPPPAPLADACKRAGRRVRAATKKLNSALRELRRLRAQTLRVGPERLEIAAAVGKQRRRVKRLRRIRHVLTHRERGICKRS